MNILLYTVVCHPATVVFDLYNVEEDGSMAYEYALKKSASSEGNIDEMT